MTPIRLFTATLVLALVGNLAACSFVSNLKDKMRVSCDEPQPYQAAVEHKRIVSPEGLDQLDELREMQIPTATTAPRPAGSECIEYPPLVVTPS